MVREIVWGLLMAAMMGAGPAMGGEVEEVPPRQNEDQPKAKIVVIGVDGVSLNLLQPMLERGVMPQMERLLLRGRAMPLTSIWPLRTPQVWTSAVTGKYPGQHGIWDHRSNTYFNPPPVRTKKNKRVTSRDRRSKALWKILDEEGYKTLTVGWVASWPAEVLKNGGMIAPMELIGDARQTSIKPSFYRGTPNAVTPVALHKEMESKYVEASEIRASDLKEFASLPPRRSPLYKLPRLRRYTYALKWSLARARSVEKLTLAGFDKLTPEVVFSYFQCSDTLLHRFWIFQESQRAIRRRFREHGISRRHVAELKRRFGGVVQGCYADIDRRVGRILKHVADSQTLVVLLSDHGFGPAKVPHQMPGEPYSGSHLEDGVLLLSGPGVRTSGGEVSASILDITPTLLTYLGEARGEDMPGRVLHDLFDSIKYPSSRTITSYEVTPQQNIPFREGWPPRHIRTKAELALAENAQGY